MHGKQLTTGGKGYNNPVFIRKLSDGKVLSGTIAQYGKISKLTLIRLESNGKVDSSFATNGILLSDNIPAYYYGQSIVLDSAENIYIGGGNNYSPFRITKHHRNGTPDFSFGINGFVEFGVKYQNARAQIKLGNNYIYLLGNLNSKNGYPFEIQKIDLNGNLDNSFGHNGVIALTSNYSAPELEITTDNKLLVTGGWNQIIIQKYLQDGNFDQKFGQNGEVIYVDTTLRPEMEKSLILKDQSIIISGRSAIPKSFKFLLKYSQDGILDSGFGSNGFLRVTDSIAQHPFDLYIFSDEQNITTVHNERINNEEIISIKKFTLDGKIKTNFANDGKLTLLYPGLSGDYGDAYQDQNGNILITNKLYTFSKPGYSQITFLNKDGSFNTSFADQGILELLLGHYAIYSSQLLSLNNNELFQGGTQYYDWGSNIQLNKFNINAKPDSNWSVNGVFTPPRIRTFHNNWCGTIQTDGNILIGGSESVDTITDQPDQMYVCRILPSGQIDSSFGYQGVSHISDKYHYPLEAYSIAQEKNGSILVSGYSSPFYPSIIRLDSKGFVQLAFDKMKYLSNRVSNKILMAKDDKIYNIGVGYYSKSQLYYSHVTRYLPDGKLDLEFGDSASTIISTATNDILLSGALDQHERILLAGYDTISGGAYEMFACRVLPNGKIDSSFANNGIFRYKVNNQNSLIAEVLIDKQGRIYLGGTGYKTTKQDFILLCLDENGNLINSFGENGLVYVDFNDGDDYITSMIFDSDQNIILGGNSESTESYYMALAKVINNLNVGTIDETSNAEMQYIYPNPILDKATLKFSLNQAGPVSISISDVNGKLIDKLLSSQYYATGKHQLELQIPHELITGYYIITIHTTTQSRSVKFLKQ
jgi:uncharacterized delta-60 repeat protein